MHEIACICFIGIFLRLQHHSYCHSYYYGYYTPHYESYPYSMISR